MINSIVLILLLFATTTGAGGIVLMKLGTNKLKWRKIHRNRKLILGIILFGLSTLFFISSLKFGDLHTNYTLTGMTYVWLLLLSRKFAEETITKEKIIGTLLIIAGIALLNL